MDLRGSQYLSKEELIEFLRKIPAGYRSPRDRIFAEGDKYWKVYTKKGVITVDDEDDPPSSETIVCNVPNCGQVLDSVFAYQTHYDTLHRYSCSQCKKNLPSPHLLDLHLSEQHDSYFAAQAERQPMYACFLQECQHKSLNPEERRDHCITTHKFPHNFRFDKTVVTKKGEKVESKLSDPSDSSHGETSKDSSARRHFSFGPTQSRGFKHKVCAKLPPTPAKQKSEEEMEVGPLEDDTIVELMESLPC